MKSWFLLLVLLLQIPVPQLETGVVTGTVRQADGKPAAGVRVAAMPADAANGADLGSTLVALTQTDESGRYRLEGVPPGDYYIAAGRVDAPTFYPGTPQLGSANTVTVTAGATIDAIDFRVTPQSMQKPSTPFGFFPTPPSPGIGLLPTIASPVRIAGRVVMEEGSKGAQIPQTFAVVLRIQTGIRLLDRSISSTSVQSPVSPAADGSFSVLLRPGPASISIVGLPQGYSVKSVTSGGADLLSQRADIQQGMSEIVVVLAADLRPRFSVSGTAVDSATGRGLLGEHIELIPESGTTLRLIIDSRGEFNFTSVLPGNYVLRVNSARFNPIEQRIHVSDTAINVELRATAR